MNIEILAWMKQPGSTDYNAATGLATDAANNVYITGYTDGELAAGKQVDDNDDSWLAKFQVA